MTIQAPHLYLVDGTAYTWRAFHAYGNTVRFSDNMPIAAVKGFCDMLWKLLRSRIMGEDPSHVAVVFDHARSRSHRQLLSPSYKANRPPVPDDIKHQFGLVRQAARAFDLACISVPGYEADDVIATYTRQAVEAGGTVVVVSGDKDFYQLVSDQVMIFDPWWLPPEARNRKEGDTTRYDIGRVVGELEVREKFGVEPGRVVDVQALMGDVADNVPGVPGIGQKIASALVIEHGSLANVLKNAIYVKQDKRRQMLMEHADDARLGLELVTLVDDVLVPPIDELTRFPADTDTTADLICFLKGLEQFPLAQRVCETYGLAFDDYTATPSLAEPGAGTGWRFRHE